MSRSRFRVTFDTVTEESAAAGDYAESGYAHPGGWRYPATDPGPHEVTLREALRTIGYHGKPARGAFEDCGRWFATADREVDYRSGEDIGYSIHPPDHVTPSSYRRLARVLGARRDRS